MTDAVKSVIREIFPGRVKAPQEGDPLYGYIFNLASAIIDVRNNKSLPPHSRLHELMSLWCEAYNTVAQGYFAKSTSSAMRKFYPGGHSEDGFLGWGESLGDIISDDKQTLRRLRNIPKVSGKEPHEVVGARLKEVLDTPGNFPKIKLSTSSVRGGQPCPFDGCYDTIPQHSDTQFTIVRGRNGLVGPGMAWHLIQVHCFFEGAYSPYRVDPERLVEILFD